MILKLIYLLLFELCLTGPMAESPFPSSCIDGDFARDGDVDLLDFAIMTSSVQIVAPRTYNLAQARKLVEDTAGPGCFVRVQPVCPPWPSQK